MSVFLKNIANDKTNITINIIMDFFIFYILNSTFLYFFNLRVIFIKSISNLNLLLSLYILIILKLNNEIFIYSKYNLANLL